MSRWISALQRLLHHQVDFTEGIVLRVSIMGEELNTSILAVTKKLQLPLIDTSMVREEAHQYKSDQTWAKRSQNFRIKISLQASRVILGNQVYLWAQQPKQITDSLYLRNHADLKRCFARDKSKLAPVGASPPTQKWCMWAGCTSRITRTTKKNTRAFQNLTITLRWVQRGIN